MKNDNLDSEELFNIFDVKKEFDEICAKGNYKFSGLCRDNPLFEFFNHCLNENAFNINFIANKNDTFSLEILSDKQDILFCRRNNKWKSFESFFKELSLFNNNQDIEKVKSKGTKINIQKEALQYKKIKTGDKKSIKLLHDKEYYKNWIKKRVITIIAKKLYEYNSKEFKFLNSVNKVSKNGKVESLERIISILFHSLKKSKEIADNSNITKEDLIEGEKSIWTKNINIKDLISLVKKGLILIPRFQRDFIWSSKKISELFNSIFKNFPIGNLLMSNMKIDFKSKNFIVDTIKEKKDKEPFFVLDGQQRLSSLLLIFCYSEILQNSGRIESPKELEKEIKKINDLYFYEGKIYYKNIDIKNIDKNEYKVENKISEIFELLKTYEIPVTFIGDEHKDNLVDIFNSINIGSQKLTNLDLSHSMIYSTYEKFDFLDSITKIQKSQIIGDFQLKKEIIAQTLKLITDIKWSNTPLGKKHEINLSTKNIFKESSNYEFVKMMHMSTAETQKTLEASIKFLEMEYGFINNIWLPNKAYILVVAYMIYKKGPKIQNIQEYEIARNLKKRIKEIINYIMYQSMNKHFSSGTVSKINSLINELDNKNSIKIPTYEEIKDLINKSKIYYGKKTSIFKHFIGMLRLKSPVSLVDGKTEVDVKTTKYKKENNDLHHFIPKKNKDKEFNFLTEEKRDSYENIVLINVGENRKIISSKSPNEYLLMNFNANNKNKYFKKIAETHIFDVDKFKDFPLDDKQYEELLEIRKKNLTKELQELFKI